VPGRSPQSYHRIALTQPSSNDGLSRRRFILVLVAVFITAGSFLLTFLQLRDSC
jgi:hypothetical protein